MSWKKITTIPIMPYHPSDPIRKLSDEDEASLRSLHGEMLDHEQKYIEAKRDLAVHLDQFTDPETLFFSADKTLHNGEPSLPKKYRNKSLIDFSVKSYDSIQTLIKSGLRGFKTRAPRFDWRDNCQACGRSLSFEDNSEVGIPRTPRRERRDATFEDLKTTSELSYKLAVANRGLKQKRFALADFMKGKDLSAMALLFNRRKDSIGQWIENTHREKAHFTGNCRCSYYRQAPCREARSLVSTYGQVDGKCSGCRREIVSPYVGMGP